MSTESPAWHRRHLPPAPQAPKCSSARHCGAPAAVNTNTHTQARSKNNQASHCDASSPSPGELCLSYSLEHLRVERVGEGRKEKTGGRRGRGEGR